MIRCSTTLTMPTMTHPKIWQLRVCMVGGVRIRMWRYAGRDHFWMFLVSLFSPSHLWISARDKWRRLGFLPPAETIKWRWIFPVRQMCQKVAIERYRSVVVPMRSYHCVRSMIVSIFVSLSFFLSYWLWQPRRSALKERDNETARLHKTCAGPRNGHSI